MSFYPPNYLENQNCEKTEKASRDVIISHLCTKNHDPVIYSYSDMECDRQVFVILGHFLFLPHYWPRKLKLGGKNVKNTQKYYPFTHVYHKWRSYDVWFLGYWGHHVELLRFFGLFFALFLPNNLENQNFEKMKKTSGDIILLRMSTINENQDVWFLRYEGQQTDFFGYFGPFLPFSPLTTWKIVILKKMK